MFTVFKLFQGNRYFLYHLLGFIGNVYVAFSSSLLAEVLPQSQPLMGDLNPCLEHCEKGQFCSQGVENLNPYCIWLKLISQLLSLQVFCLHDAQ